MMGKMLMILRPIPIPRTWCEHLGMSHVAPFFIGSLFLFMVAGGEDAPTSMQSLPDIMEYLARVVVQDALQLTSQYLKNPVFVFLAKNKEFRSFMPTSSAREHKR